MPWRQPRSLRAGPTHLPGRAGHSPRLVRRGRARPQAGLRDPRRPGRSQGGARRRTPGLRRCVRRLRPRRQPSPPRPRPAGTGSRSRRVLASGRRPRCPGRRTNEPRPVLRRLRGREEPRVPARAGARGWPRPRGWLWTAVRGHRRRRPGRRHDGGLRPPGLALRAPIPRDPGRARPPSRCRRPPPPSGHPRGDDGGHQRGHRLLPRPGCPRPPRPISALVVDQMYATIRRSRPALRLGAVPADRSRRLRLWRKSDHFLVWGTEKVPDFAGNSATGPLAAASRAGGPSSC